MVELNPKPVLRIRDIYPGFEKFSIPDPVSKRYRIPNPVPHQRIKVFLNQKNVSKISEIRSRMFIPYQDLDFLPIPDHGSGSATLSKTAHPAAAQSQNNVS
jgi:hypothetical protein